MRTIKALTAILIALALQGCFNGDISRAKNKTLNDNGLTFETALEEMANCKSVKWSSFEDDRKKSFVKASCDIDPQKMGWTERDKQQAVERIDEYAASLKADYDKRIVATGLAMNEEPRPLIDGATAAAVAYAQAEPERMRARLEELQQRKGEVYAAVEAGRVSDLQALQNRFAADHSQVAEFIFAPGKDAAQLVGLRSVRPDRTYDVPPFDVFQLIIFITTKDANGQLRFWGGNRLERADLTNNLREVDRAFDLSR